jgi:hypothetical protein
MEEVWKDVVGWEGSYEISSFGRLRSKPFLKRGCGRSGPFTFWTKERILKPSLNADGYVIFRLQRDGVRESEGIHRLVAIAFLPNPDNLPEVNHKDSVRSNNHADNLEWVTSQQNARHAFDSGNRSNARERHPRAVLNEDLVRNIRTMYAEGARVVDIARALGLQYWTVSRVVHNRNWKER